MNAERPFIDYYAILQVSPVCDPKELELAYHALAKIHHPDHSGDADSTRFNDVTEAFRVLRNPESRAKFDVLYANINGKEVFETSKDDFGVDERTALLDADAHAKILMYLYRKRREQAQSAGVIGFYLQELVNCSDENFEFHKWYLKEKGWVAITEQGSLEITIQGIDHVIAMSKTSAVERLLLAQSKALDD